MFEFIWIEILFLVKFYNKSFKEKMKNFWTCHNHFDSFLLLVWLRLWYLDRNLSRWRHLTAYLFSTIFFWPKPFSFSCCTVHVPTRKENIEKLPCDQFLHHFEISRAFLPPVLHRKKRGKFQNVVEIPHKAVSIFLFL